MKKTQSGFVASGHSNLWEVELDEVFGEKKSFYSITLRKALFYANFNFEDLNIVQGLLEFLIDCENQSSVFDLHLKPNLIQRIAVDEGVLKMQWVNTTYNDAPQMIECGFNELEHENLIIALKDLVIEIDNL